jgi:hypothetical protein
VLLVGLSITFTLWRFTVSDSRFQQNHLKRLTEAPREAIAALDGMETTDMNQVFRDLAKQVDEAAHESHAHPADNCEEHDAFEDDSGTPDGAERGRR